MLLDHERWPYLIGGAFGAVFFAMVKVGLTVLHGQSPTAKDLALASANIALGVMCGVVAAPIIGPPLATIIPMEGLRDPIFVGFVVGALAWETAPVCIEWAKRWFNNRSEGAK